MFTFIDSLRGKETERRRKIKKLLNEINLTPNELFYLIVLLKNIGTDKVFTIKDVIKLEKETKFLQKKNLQYRTQYLRNLTQSLKKLNYIEDLGKDKDDKRIHYYKLKVDKDTIKKILELHKLIEDEIKDLQKEIEILETLKNYIKDIEKNLKRNSFSFF